MAPSLHGCSVSRQVPPGTGGKQSLHPPSQDCSSCLQTWSRAPPFLSPESTPGIPLCATGCLSLSLSLLAPLRADATSRPSTLPGTSSVALVVITPSLGILSSPGCVPRPVFLFLWDPEAPSFPAPMGASSPEVANLQPLLALPGWGPGWTATHNYTARTRRVPSKPLCPGYPAPPRALQPTARLTEARDPGVLAGDGAG